MMTPRRRFTIADGMILVAASAVGLLILREDMPGFLEELRTPGAGLGTTPARLLLWVVGPPSGLFVAWAPGLIAVRLRSPRPRGRRLVRQPGLVAAVALLVAIVPGLLWCLSLWSYRPGFRDRFNFHERWVLVTEWADAAVAGSWLALIVAGRWRAEASWIDRLGRISGGYWVFRLLILIFFQGIDALFNLL